MTKVFLPIEGIKAGGTLSTIASELNVFSNLDKSAENGHIVYSFKHQELVEHILTHDNIMLIVENGGEIKDYIMIAEVPFEIDGNSVYNCDVPEGLPHRTIKITDGTQIVTATKKLGQWANAKLVQSFSEDFQKIYVETCPISDWLSGRQLKIFVDAFEAKLLTRKEYALITTV